MDPPTFDQIFGCLWNLIDNEQCVNAIKEIFADDKTNEDRFVLALQNLQTFDILPFCDDVGVKGGKSEDLSVELRTAGNELFGQAKPDFRAALGLYTRSIACAPAQGSDTRQLAVAFANRSAVFMAIKKYRLCLKDIEQAEKLDYPEQLRIKLSERKKNCCLHMGLSNKNIALNIAIQTEIPNYDELLESTISTLENVQINTETESEELMPVLREIPKLSFGTHGKISSFSRCIDVEHAEMGGRFIRATKDIQPGDVLALEKPYSSILQPDNFLTHCFHCLQRCEGLIPCLQCTTAMFCSEQCRGLSRTYHDLECPILRALLDLDMGHDWLLPLRVVLVASSKNNGLVEFQENIRALELHHRDKDITGFEASARFQCNDPLYSVIHYLVQNTSRRTFKNAYRLTTIAACVVNCLSVHTDMFARCEDVDAMQRFVGGLLVQYLLSFTCNSYSVADLVQKTTGDKSVATESFASAIYPFSSYFNHSCDPHVFRSFYNGDTMAVVALRPIQRGEHVYCDYGYTYDKIELNDRRIALESEYYFTCYCEACDECWPVSSTLENLDTVFLCAHCEASLVEDQNYKLEVCRVCQKKNSQVKLGAELERLAQSVCEIKRRLLDGCRHDFSQRLADLLIVLGKLLERPHQAIIVAEDALRHNIMALGNFYRI